jgi:hypothetical protein
MFHFIFDLYRECIFPTHKGEYDCNEQLYMLSGINCDIPRMLKEENLMLLLCTIPTLHCSNIPIQLKAVITMLEFSLSFNQPSNFFLLAERGSRFVVVCAKEQG